MPIFRHLNAGAVFAWRLDDLADIRRRGTVVGNPTVLETGRGRALHVSEGNNITATRSVGKFPHGANGDFSLAFWLRTSDSLRIVLGNKRIDGDEKGFAVRFVATVIILKIGNDIDYTEVQSTTDVIDGEWHHIAFTVDRDATSYAYVDGAREGGVANVEDGVDISSPLDLAIGCDALGSFNMEGDLQDVMIWDRVLTTAEVLGLATGRSF